MANAIKQSDPTSSDASRYWGRLFVETPVCTVPGCDRVAHEVDAFFPFIDDYNRCDRHPSPIEGGTIH